MFQEIFKNVTKGLKTGYVLLIIMLCITGGFMWQINETTTATHDLVVEMDNRYYDDIYDKGASTMNTLIDKGFTTHQEIREFLAPKPAGRDNLKKAVTTPQTYERLVNTYGELANVAKMAVDF